MTTKLLTTLTTLTTFACLIAVAQQTLTNYDFSGRIDGTNSTIYQSGMEFKLNIGTNFLTIQDREVVTLHGHMIIRNVSDAEWELITNHYKASVHTIVFYGTNK